MEAGREDVRFKDQRRPPLDEAKFATQKRLVYVMVFIFAASAVWVFWKGDEAQQAAYVQTIINLTIAGFMYFIGSSKGSGEKETQLNKLGNASIDPETAANIADTAESTAKTAANTEKP